MSSSNLGQALASGPRLAVRGPPAARQVGYLMKLVRLIAPAVFVEIDW